MNCSENKHWPQGNVFQGVGKEEGFCILWRKREENLGWFSPFSFVLSRNKSKTHSPWILMLHATYCEVTRKGMIKTLGSNIWWWNISGRIQYSSRTEASTYLDPYAVCWCELFLTCICYAGFPVNAYHRVFLSVSGCYVGWDTSTEAEVPQGCHKQWLVQPLLWPWKSMACVPFSCLTDLE